MNEPAEFSIYQVNEAPVSYILVIYSLRQLKLGPFYPLNYPSLFNMRIYSSKDQV
jgi:hypothetical protein